MRSERLGAPHISPEVQTALMRRAPIVALETAIVGCGLPWPDNLETARACEAAVRGAGAVPATLGIVGGRVTVGMSDAEIEKIARPGSECRKINPQNFAACVADGADGALTVASSLAVARAAGLQVFATGGLGGVHRGWAQSLDVSADLQALAKSPLVVTCSGVKSILDVPATLEALESLGVALAGWKTDTFPLFTVRESQYPVSPRYDAMDALTRCARVHLQFVGSAFVVANPAPESMAIPAAEFAQWLAKAEAEGVPAGRQSTPFLLGRLVELSGGRTLTVNKALVIENSRLAGEIAVELSKQNESEH